MKTAKGQSQPPDQHQNRRWHHRRPSAPQRCRPLQQRLPAPRPASARIVAITNTSGVVVERLAYDPWGKRRFASGTNTGKADTLDAITGATIDRGFTMHEHIDEMGIINMNGRIYDPLIGRFMSADPYIQAPDDLQSHNRYAYVMNNPLNLTDPSGFSWLSKTWKKAWKSPIFKAVLGIVVAFVAPYALTWLAPTLFGASSLATALATGALSGFASTGTLKGAMLGAFTAGLMHGVGTIGVELGLESGGIGKIALHAGAGCISSVAGGGSCKTGALSGALGEFGNNIPTSGMALGTVKAAMLGGIGAKIGGGKFADGATTGAFGYLFNECMHTKACGSDSTKVEASGNKVLGNTAHTEIQISNGYTGIDVLEGQPGMLGFGKLEGRSNGANTGDAFLLTLSPPSGSTTTQFANDLRAAASQYKDTLNYSFPPIASGSNNYNSNSYVGGVLNAVAPGYGGQIIIEAWKNKFSVPGMDNPIPLKRIR